MAITVPLSLVNTKNVNFSCRKTFFEIKGLVCFSSYGSETFLKILTFSKLF